MRRSISALLTVATLSLGLASVTALAADPTTTATTAPANLLKDVTFDSTSDGGTWQVSNLNDASASIAKDTTAPADHPALVIKVDKVTATDWNAQVFQAGLTVSKGAKYQLTFTGKASAARKIAVFIQQLSDPYKMLTEGHAVDLTPDATPQTIELTATDDSTDAKLTFTVGQSTGTVTLSDVSLVKE